MKFERGGFVVGLIVGLMLGLAVALGVALYVTKVPVPFIHKVPQRTAQQDAAEAEKNRNWDPNGPLYGKNPARPSAASAADAGIAPGAAPAIPPPVADTAAAAGPRAAAPAPRDSAAVAPQERPSANALRDPFTYFVQAGAYTHADDAEQQRAKLAMVGLAAKVSEREQLGRTVYRVRVGPFETKDEAEAAKQRVDASGMEATLVRVQR